MIIVLSILALFSFTLSANNDVYIIEKVNKGTHFLKPGQKFEGYLDRNEVCGAQGGNMPGSEACAVVTPVTISPRQQLYNLKVVYKTGTPDPNLVGFIEGSEKEGTGIGGTKATGVFKIQPE